MLASTHCSTFCIAVMVAKGSERRSKALHTPLTRKCCHNDSRLLPVLTPFLNSPECWHSPKIIPFNSVTTNLLIQRSELPLLLFQLHFPLHKQSTFLNASYTGSFTCVYCFIGTTYKMATFLFPCWFCSFLYVMLLGLSTSYSYFGNKAKR